MTKRYKIKEWFKKHFTKKKIVSWILTAIIIVLVLLCVYFENKDKKQMQNKTSDISLVETDDNLNKAWSIDNQGNLVGNNLFNGLWELGYLNANGSVAAATTSLVSVDYISVRPNTTYYISGGTETVICKYGSNKESLGADSWFIWRGGNESFTTDNNTYYLRLAINNGVNDFYNIMLNLGSTPLPWEPYGVWYSDSNYDNVIEQLENQTNMNKYGWLSYIDNVHLKYNNNNSLSYYLTFEELKSGNYIGSDSSLNLYTLSEHNNPNYYNALIEISFANALLNTDTIPSNLFGLTTREGFLGTITIYDDDSQTAVINVDGATSLTFEDIYSANQNFSDKIASINFAFTSPDAATTIYTNSGYANGYQNGYNMGYSVMYRKAQEEMSKSLDIKYKEGYNVGYQVGLNEGATQDLSSNGMKILFDSILSYPINMMSSVFNFEFMGINIASTLFFLISCGIVLWVIKRLWK